MGMVRSSVQEFTKGLVSDSIGVDKALFEAFDVYLDRGGELRFRGPKTAVAAAPASSLNRVVTAYDAHPRFGQMRYSDLSSDVWSPLGLGSVNDLYVRRPQDAAWALVADPFGLQYASFGDGITAVLAPFTHRLAFVNERMVGCQPFVCFEQPPAVGVQYRAACYWAGGTKARYRVGTVTVAAGNPIVTGVGTAWLANVEPGMFLVFAGGVPGESTPPARITRVISNTSLVVENPYPSAVVGASYSISSYVAADVQGFFPWLTGSVTASVFAQHQARMIAGGLVGHGPQTPVGATDQPLAPHDIAWSGQPPDRDPAFPFNIGLSHWNVSARQAIEPGIGKIITGMVSFGGALLVLKDTGVFVVTGDLQTDGSDAGIAVQRVSAVIGCQGLRAYDAAEEGVYFADQNGAYIFNREGVKNLTKGVVSREWNANMVGELTVSALRDRVIFQGGTNRDQVYVYDTMHEVWVRQRIARSYSKVGRVFNTSGQQVREDALVRVDPTGLNSIVHDWAGDYGPGPGAGSGNDGGDATAVPRMDITTHPLPATRQKGGKGRPLSVLVDAWLLLNAVTASIAPFVRFGTRLPGIGARNAVTLDPIIPASSSGQVTRRRVTPSEHTDAVMVRLLQVEAATDGAVYGVTVESAELGRHDS